jgi:hypothetical protein
VGKSFLPFLVFQTSDKKSRYIPLFSEGFYLKVNQITVEINKRESGAGYTGYGARLKIKNFLK